MEEFFSDPTDRRRPQGEVHQQAVIHQATSGCNQIPDPVTVEERISIRPVGNLQRRRPDSNRGWRFCRPLPYHLATAPRCDLIRLGSPYF